MKPVRLNPVIRLLPSLTDVAFLMPLVFLFVRLDGAKTMLGDGDTGWHIRTGDWILANGRVPSVDMFSFTRNGEPWFAWEWLWDVMFAWLHREGGLAAVVLASILVVCITFSLLFRLVRRRCPENPLVAIAVTIAACAGSSIHWLARPHLFTMLFLVIFLSVLDRVQREQRDPRLLWSLPLLAVLWTNLHGGFLMGILVLLAYAGGSVAAAVVTPDPLVRARCLREARWYGWALAGCAAASLVNPYSWRLHVHLYRYLTDPFQFNFITEFFSFNFHHPVAPWVEVMLWLAILLSVRSAAVRGEYVSLLLVAGLSHIALYAARNIPLFLIAAAPVVAQGVDELLTSIPGQTARFAAWVRHSAASVREAGQDIAPLDREWRLHIVSGFSVLVVALLLRAPLNHDKWRPEFDPKRYPASAVRMLLEQQMGERIFTDDEWGDYLIYRTYPQRLVFVDGRSDFYGGAFDEKFIHALNVKFDWESYLGQYRVDTVLLPTASPLAGAIKESSNWQIVYDDTVAIIFRRSETGQMPPISTGNKNADQTSMRGKSDASKGMFEITPGASLAPDGAKPSVRGAGTGHPGIHPAARIHCSIVRGTVPQWGRNDRANLVRRQQHYGGCRVNGVLGADAAGVSSVCES